MNKIIIIGGGKGGVGKSTVSMSVLDLLRVKENETVYVESDDSNPDVYKAVNKQIKSEICNLDDETGYINLGGIIEANSNACIVVNTAARAMAGIIEHGVILTEVVEELGRELVMLWPVNRQRDSLELLKNFLDNAQGYKSTYAVLNTYFGGAEKFTRYESSKIKGRVTGTIVFPELNDLVSDKLTDARMPSWSDENLTIAERSALRKYRDASSKALGVVYE